MNGSPLNAPNKQWIVLFPFVTIKWQNICHKNETGGECRTFSTANCMSVSLYLFFTLLNDARLLHLRSKCYKKQVMTQYLTDDRLRLANSFFFMYQTHSIVWIVFWRNKREMLPAFNGKLNNNNPRRMISSVCVDLGHLYLQLNAVPPELTRCRKATNQ